MSAEEITLFMKELVYGQYLAVAAVTTIVFDSREDTDNNLI